MNDKDNQRNIMIDKLKELQDKISTFEANYDSKYNHLEKRSRINKDLDDKLEKLTFIQKSVITIDLQGQEMQTSSEIINNCKFSNILQAMIVDNNKIFLDTPKKYFKRIMFILSNKTKETNSKIIKVEITEKMTEVLMLSVIKTIFKGDEVLKEIKVTKKNKEHTGNVMDFLYRKQEIEIIPQLNPYADDYNYNRGDDLFDDYNYNRRNNRNRPHPRVRLQRRYS